MAYPVTEPRILDEGTVLGYSGPPNNRAVQNAVAVGVAASQVWIHQPGAGDQANIIDRVTMAPVGGTMTTLTVDHEISSDNGVTWNKKGATMDFIATPTFEITTGPGILNRLNIKTFALNTATSLCMDVAA